MIQRCIINDLVNNGVSMHDETSHSVLIYSFQLTVVTLADDYDYDYDECGNQRHGDIDHSKLCSLSGT